MTSKAWSAGLLLTVQNGSKVKTFRIKENADNYTIGDKVIIQYADEDDGSELRANEIKKL